MRLPDRGRIDRSRPLRFTFDGTEYTGFDGDTLASALLANGVHEVGASVRFGRPRGITSAGAEEAGAFVQVERPYAEPMLPATGVWLRDGLVARGLRGKGVLPDEPDTARYDRRYAHCEVLVVGAGPAGLTAALAASRSGERVILVDEQPEPGGSLLGSRDILDELPATEWARQAAERLRSMPHVTVLTSTTAVGHFDDNYVLAVQAEPDARTRQRAWHIRAGRVVLATGAHELPLVFTGNDRPGIMLAGAARQYLNRYGVLAGQRVVVFTSHDSAYAAAVELAEAGARVTVLDARAEAPPYWAARCAAWHVDILPGHAVHGTAGDPHVSTVDIGPSPEDTWRVDCDLLLTCGGWNPATALFTQARGTLRFDRYLGAFVPGASPRGVTVVGAAAGEFTLSGCLADGARGEPVPLPATADGFVPAPSGERVWAVPAPEQARARQFVDLTRDATVADIERATGAGLRSVEHVKRYTTIGTGPDQGRTSATTTSGIVAGLLGVDIAELGTPSLRPPYRPVLFAALAGRDRGDLLDPARITALHDWHVEAGAVFEDVGQWKRPRYYPRDGESMEQAVLRECAAARTGVAMLDASTLGKIDVHGPDAGEFLDRLYTNMISTLKVGRVRYGVMCKADGMVFDDGTVIRVGEQRFLVTTTTGNAAAVLEWMEEWLQTEWPDLRVHCTSVTEQWATIALVGPGSRALLGELAPSLDVSNEAFGFMTWHDAYVAGVAARVCRISFSGELAYEINVSPWSARTVWDALAGRGVTPYGTETMHVLRAEKGYPIIGQDTDGTVNPHDLGLSWAVSKKKLDFVGKRSLSRVDSERPDRLQFVGLLPEDPAFLLDEGAQLVAGEPPSPMLGHVTSSYRSAALGRTFALALLAGGRERAGQTLYAVSTGGVVPVTVTSSVLFDPEGARRDG
ncbi:2Fe-2S iron-sulfur cluster-binding protein [Amycolatopsis suaedae]|uniref:FAD-dependent oxidoreductase n=1 Tax=Amycolatopsis suaedae TaxID=2510978 RepID=A0A4Q7IYK4_9PSEU|nr:2Fe-2S iron-sulfur cluster-binding protein [Amycolatopsis suaedae]RZQ60071.1 FAD-dependent oxidoreductase [Amycolatopsis suaedae]